MSSPNDNSSSEPSQIAGKLNQAKGTVYQAIGSLPGASGWSKSGDELKKEGQQEVEEARGIAQGEATRDRLYGKGQSALGVVMGDQDKQNEGNIRAEKAEWKSAAARGELPSASATHMKGKLESAVGMVTGNQDKQTEGNIKAEKAEWTQG